MASAAKSLRCLVDHWLAPDHAKAVKVVEFNRRSNHVCYVCVEVTKAGGPVAMLFFRHRDGQWCIFPPNRERPAMRVSAPSEPGNVDAVRVAPLI